MIAWGWMGPRFQAALPAWHMSCVHSSLTSHILHTSYSTTLIFLLIIFTGTQPIMPYTLLQLSFLTKKATCFTVRCSSLKPPNFNLHFWMCWAKKITHIWRLIRFVLWHIDITLKISIGGMEITLSPRPCNCQAVGPEDNVWAPGLQKRGGNREYWLWGDQFPKYTLSPISTFNNGVCPSMYIEIYHYPHLSLLLSSFLLFLKLLIPQHTPIFPCAWRNRIHAV
jgi:hypothetical protein